MTDRLFRYDNAFEHPVTTYVVIGALGLLAIAPLLILLATRLRDVSDESRTELWKRYLSWLVLTPLMIGPVLLGAFWVIISITLLSLLCHREFARITGSFRNRTVHLVVVLGTLLTMFAALDHWYGLFVAAWPLTTAAIAIIGLATDDPKGYVQRVALGVLGFMLFGAGLGHLAYFANDANYRPILLMLIVGVQLNDVFAFCSGKLLGRRKMSPNISPNKTWGGALGAIVLTSTLVAGIASHVFAGTAMDRWPLLIGLGLLVSVLGQLGDLMLSAIKRDVGVKDTGHIIPGHGGLLDRFDSTMLVAPAIFHYVGYFLGVGLNESTRIITGPG